MVTSHERHGVSGKRVIITVTSHDVITGKFTVCLTGDWWIPLQRANNTERFSFNDAIVITRLWERVVGYVLWSQFYLSHYRTEICYGGSLYNGIDVVDIFWLFQWRLQRYLIRKQFVMQGSITNSFQLQYYLKVLLNIYFHTYCTNTAFTNTFGVTVTLYNS